MFTSRAEFRLHLRPDNADSRLTPLGFDAGCVSESRYQQYQDQRRKLDDAETRLREFRLSLGEWKHRLPWLSVVWKISHGACRQRVVQPLRVSRFFVLPFSILLFSFLLYFILLFHFFFVLFLYIFFFFLSRNRIRPS